MKKRLKQITKFIAICALITLYGCEKELYEDSLNDDGKKIIKTVSLDDLPFLKKEINQEKNSKNFNNKEIDYLQYIEESRIVVIENESNFKTYNFSLTIQETGKLLNLSIKETIDGYKYYLIKYTSANFDQWLNEIVENGYSLIEAQTEIKELNRGTPCYDTVVQLTCPSGKHHGGDTDCDYPIEEWSIVFSIGEVPCDAGGGGDDYSSGGVGAPTNSNTSSGQSGGGSQTGPIMATPIPCVDCIKDETVTDHCPSLSNLMSPSRQVVTAINQVNNLAVNYNGEQGAYLYNNSSTYTAPVAPPSTNANGQAYSINFALTSNVYGIIHSHPVDGEPAAAPMFSYADLVLLYNIYRKTAPENRPDVVVILVLPNGSTYALKVDNFVNLSTYVNSFTIMKSVTRYENIDDQNDEINRNFDNICSSNAQPGDPNMESKYVRGFVDETKGKGLSLYKMKDDNTWKKIESPDNPSDALPKITSCNN